MNKQKFSRICSLSLGLLLLCVSPAYASEVSIPVASEEQQPHQEKILTELEQANIIYLGENHDSLEDHQAQLEIIQALYQKNPHLTIALEMFQRPFQGAIDAYLAGEITEEELIERSEYEQRWGFPWEYYAPILRFAKEHNLSVLALNAPTEVTRKVARQGLESLTEEEKTYLPPLAEIRTDDAEYRQMLQEIFQMHSHQGHGNSAGFENFFAAQVVWDETMAKTIAEFYQTNPSQQIIVLAGQGHIVYGYGIPQRVARRIKQDSFTQISVLLGITEEEITPENEEAIADYFWFQ
ncbi:MAG: ChaN family lipoprotein [Spirulinaceae cyanobacterium]